MSNSIGDRLVLTRCSYVGNTIAALVMQSLGCEVAAVNTVQFSKNSWPTMLLMPGGSIGISESNDGSLTLRRQPYWLHAIQRQQGLGRRNRRYLQRVEAELSSRLRFDAFWLCAQCRGRWCSWIDRPRLEAQSFH